jgi:hypothetical protein
MRRRFALTLIVTGALIVGAVTQAQIANPFWGGHQDFPLPESPCGESNTAEMAPLLKDGEVWILYRCHFGPSFLRRHAVTAPHGLTPPGVPTSTCTTVNPGPAFTCVEGSWVYTG